MALVLIQTTLGTLMSLPEYFLVLGRILESAQFIALVFIQCHNLLLLIGCLNIATLRYSFHGFNSAHETLQTYLVTVTALEWMSLSNSMLPRLTASTEHGHIYYVPRLPLQETA